MWGWGYVNGDGWGWEVVVVWRGVCGVDEACCCGVATGVVGT